MRFLDNVVSGMISNATGLPARRLVRKVGAGRLLLLGGAAAAGSLAAGRSAAWPPQASALPVPGTKATGASPSKPPATPPPVRLPTLRQMGPAPPPTPMGKPTVGPVPPPPPPWVTPQLPVEPLPDPEPEPCELVSTPDLPPPPPETQATDEEPGLSPSLSYAVVRTLLAAALADGDMAPEERRLIDSHLNEEGLDADQVRQIRRELVVPATPQKLATLVSPADADVLFRAAVLGARADGAVSGEEQAWLDRLAAALGLPQERQRALQTDFLESLEKSG